MYILLPGLWLCACLAGDFHVYFHQKFAYTIDNDISIIKLLI